MSSPDRLPLQGTVHRHSVGKLNCLCFDDVYVIWLIVHITDHCEHRKIQTLLKTYAPIKIFTYQYLPFTINLVLLWFGGVTKCKRLNQLHLTCEMTEKPWINTCLCLRFAAASDDLLDLTARRANGGTTPVGSMMTVVNGNPASEMECNTAVAEDRHITPIPSYSKKQEKIDTASKRDLSPNTCMWSKYND